MSRASASTLIALLALLSFPSALRAQPPNTPTLDQILDRLQANLDRYDAHVPSFFCDEHVASRIEPGQRSDNVVTDSIFRLKRTANPDHTSTLTESREIRLVNGKPPASPDFEGPALLTGAFEGGLAAVSQSQSSCMNYKLERNKRKHPADPYIVSFANVLTPQNTAGCLLQEKSKGRVFIDPASMQITHMDLTTPDHTIFRATSWGPAVIGRWVVTVDYAPVLLGGITFWMPATITSRATSDARSFHPTVWSFQATYRNYHKLEVTSRILPAD